MIPYFRKPARYHKCIALAPFRRVAFATSYLIVARRAINPGKSQRQWSVMSSTISGGKRKVSQDICVYIIIYIMHIIIDYLIYIYIHISVSLSLVASDIRSSDLGMGSWPAAGCWPVSGRLVVWRRSRCGARCPVWRASKDINSGGMNASNSFQ